MKLLRTIPEVRAAVAEARAGGATIGLVPTMGAFHAGHAALMRAAREAGDFVVTSLFVNPTQFNEQADLAAYPRDEAADAATARELGVDVLFAPTHDEIYPRGFATTVSVAGLADVLEGEHRGPGHFAGVCTVVAKLFAITTPDVAYFGQKDAQQLLVVRRMARDLDLPVDIRAIPTVREPDGLALSSRNRLLDPADRERAAALPRALNAARQAIEAGEQDPARVQQTAQAELAEQGITADYLAVVDPETLAPLTQVNGTALVALAARVGGIRLIDNTLITTKA